MRITNNMIVNNTKTNINNNKINVDKYNTQMTTQKKISKASENPVIAIRSLRLSTNLSHLNQYLDNNIPDAIAWLDVTETALTNMKNILTDIRTQCVNGSTDTLTADDRETILKELEALKDQVYTEGNSDYAGRTVFTGYRTSDQLTFEQDETETKYQIEQEFNYTDMEEHRYYTGEVEVPTNADSECTEEIGVQAHMRLRLAYHGIDSLDSLSITMNGTENTYAGGTIAGYTVTEYDSEEAWEEAGATLADDEMIFFKDTGELIFGKDTANEIKDAKATFSLTYTKTGFNEGEARPEYYYNCTDITPNQEPVVYEKQNQEIQYTIANSTLLTVNTQASDVFDTAIARDVDELITIVKQATKAHDKVTKIESMLNEAQYSDEVSQANLQTYLEAAKKEADYADDNLQKTYSQYITNFDNYLEKVNIAITNVGSTSNRLELTQTRVDNQQSTVEELKSQNEDRSISDIIIDYTAAYNAYQSSLTGASKVGERTLLDYL